MYSLRPRKFRPVAATLMFEVPETMLVPPFTLPDKGSDVLSGNLGTEVRIGLNVENNSGDLAETFSEVNEA